VRDTRVRTVTPAHSPRGMWAGVQTPRGDAALSRLRQPAWPSVDPQTMQRRVQMRVQRRLSTEPWPAPFSDLSNQSCRRRRRIAPRARKRRADPAAFLSL